MINNSPLFGRGVPHSCQSNQLSTGCFQRLMARGYAPPGPRIRRSWSRDGPPAFARMEPQGYLEDDLRLHQLWWCRAGRSNSTPLWLNCQAEAVSQLVPGTTQPQWYWTNVQPKRRHKPIFAALEPNIVAKAQLYNATWHVQAIHE